MGIVLAAYDELLDRRVAIKVLHAQHSPGNDRRQSLRREAQAMAQLSHPNVVQVFEVGEHGSQVYLAMELVQGGTLTDWLAAEPRSLEQIRDVLCGAGRGLMAAHAVGLVHRDFKPDNVLVGTDGRARVVDFGLVGLLPTQEQPPLTTISMGPPGARDKVAGTVPFMAPEQLLSQTVDARTDQFAFCVAAFEAVYGHHPFEAPGTVELGMRIICDPADRPPPGLAPQWFADALLRGLAKQPEHRYPDMGALLQALQRETTRSVRPSGWVLGMAVALMGMGLMSSVIGFNAHDACGGARRILAGTWDDDRREQVHHAMQASGVGYSEGTWSRVRDHLDDYAGRWTRADRHACEAAVASTEAEAALEPRRRCLDGRLHEMRSLVDVLVRADDTVVEHAVTAVAGLPAVAGCADTSADDAAASTPQYHPEVRRIRALVAAAQLRIDTGDPGSALALLDGAPKAAHETGYPPLYAEVLVAAGDAQMMAGKLAEAEQALSDAFWLAQANDQDRVAVRAGVRLINLVGDQQLRFDEGIAWARHTEALVARGGIGGRLAAWTLNNRGTILIRRGDYEAAEEILIRVLAIEGDDIRPTDTASFEVNLGNVYLSTERSEQARVRYERSVGLRERALGPHHPALVSSLVNLGNVHLMQEQPQPARELFERALNILDEPGQSTIRKGSTLINLGIALTDLHELDLALARLEQAHDLLVVELGESHPRVAYVLSNMADVFVQQGRLAQAEQTARRAIEIIETAVEPDHPDVLKFRRGLDLILARKLADSKQPGSGTLSAEH